LPGAAGAKSSQRSADAHRNLRPQHSADGAARAQAQNHGLGRVLLTQWRQLARSTEPAQHRERAGGGRRPVPRSSKSHSQGSNLSDLTDSVEFARGGFWRRALAVVIDAVAIGAVLQLAALALFPLSSGRVQFSGGPFQTFNCQQLEAAPEGVPIPAEFGANSITDCRQSLFGLPAARSLNLNRITYDGAVTKVVQVRHMLDVNGRPVRGWPLEIFILPLLIGLRYWLDHGRGSLGRRICGLRLADAMDGLEPPSASVNGRYVALALPLLPLWLWSACAALFPGSVLSSAVTHWLWVATGFPLLIAALEAADSIVRRRDTFYDRFAQTTVLRFDQKKAAKPIAVAAPPPGRGNPPPPRIMPEAVVASVVSPPLLPPAPRSRGYIARHWRGELSLPVSYWLNGILGALIVGATVGVLAYTINRQGAAQPTLWLVSLIVTWMSAALLTIWQAVGVWRSATRYRQSGKRFWGAAAKTLALLGVVQVAANFATVGAAQVAGIYEIVTGDARVGPHEFHVVGNGQTLQFSGGITFGVAREFEQFLNAMGSIKTVELNSTGGRILEAQNISDMIRSRNLATFVAKDCLSACTIVFLGGKQRLMMPAARLGFHQPAFRGMTGSDRRAAIETEQQRLQRFGLSREFAERANGAAPSEMWYPDQDELVREHVVTRVITPPSAPVATVVPSAPSTGIPTASEVAPPVSATGYDIGGVTLPADLLKRLSAPPRKTGGAAPMTPK
jgi:hypothetical protein